MWRESGPRCPPCFSLSLNKYTQRQIISAQREALLPGLSVCLSVCLCPLPVAARGVGFHSPTVYPFKRLLCCCLHSFFFFFGTYMGQVDGNPDLGENVALSIFERFSYPVFISICLQINTLPSPLDFASPPFFSLFFSLFSFFLFFFICRCRFRRGWKRGWKKQGGYEA